MSGTPPRIRDRHAKPPRFPWLVPLIVVVAAVMVIGGIVVAVALHVRLF